MNDPKTQIRKSQQPIFSIRKQGDVGTASGQDTKQEIVTNFNKDKRELQNINEQIFLGSIELKKVKLTEKILQLNKEAPYISYKVNKFNKKRMGINLSETIRQKQLKIMRTYERHDQANQKLLQTFKSL